MIFLYIILALMVLAGTAKIASEAKFRRVHSVSRKELAGRSWAGQQLIKEYYAIPESNRPYANIKAIVTALDLKNGIDSVNTHFSKRIRTRNGWRSAPTWDCRYVRYCQFDEYKDLHNSFESITDAIAEQQHALALAGVSDGFAEAGSLMERLREEKELINTVTKELT